MMIVLLLLFGLALSAFFSGSETGFFRVTRVRLVMDALDGNWISRVLLWLANHTTVVVATVLIGNNLANYSLSLGLVILGGQLFTEQPSLQAIVPVLAAPVIFAYGELLPKYLFYQAPYRLLRFGAPLMLLCSILFLPMSIFVFAYEAIWRRFAGQSVTKADLALRRQDIQRTLAESQDAGVVAAIQRELSQNLFTFGSRPVRQYTIPLRAIPLMETTTTRPQALAAAVRTNSPIVGITREGNLVGCCLAAEVRADLNNSSLPLLPICQVRATDSSILVLTRLQAMHAPLAQVIDPTGRAIGVVLRERLTSLLVSD
ncbi:MAG: DUF21 domain-containing protein [Pirellulaceae bacterium]|nr:DUF21 domain-containing protein [Pirellulaceae bacterium]